VAGFGLYPGQLRVAGGDFDKKKTGRLKTARFFYARFIV
jgi:hypothetical protein